MSSYVFNAFSFSGYFYFLWLDATNRMSRAANPRGGPGAEFFDCSDGDLERLGDLALDRRG